MHTKIILMNFWFVSSLQIYSIFVTFHFTTIQRGEKFLLSVIVVNAKFSFYVFIEIIKLNALSKHDSSWNSPIQFINISIDCATWWSRKNRESNLSITLYYLVLIYSLLFNQNHKTNHWWHPIISTFFIWIILTIFNPNYAYYLKQRRY